MDLSTETLFSIIALVFGIVITCLMIFLIKRTRPGQGPDEHTVQEYEKQIVKLQSDLAHAGKMIEEKNGSAAISERKLTETARQLGETTSNLNVANEKLQILAGENHKISATLEVQANELRALRETSAHLSARARSLEDNLTESGNQNNLKELHVFELTKINNQLNQEKATLQADLNAAEGRLATQKNEIEQIREKSHTEFENIANRLLESKSEKFTETNRTNIENILLPLKNDINSFKTRVEDTYLNEESRRISLEDGVKALIEQTDKVKTEAHNLTTALKGQAKTQGDWGEMILERILETNGLVRGREYDVQHPIKSEDGDQQYLDVIVHLPDNRKLIIDSKVTLKAYEQYCSSETDEDRAAHLKNHLRSLSTHIDQLSGKKYDEMEASPDFVMLFVPIEPAYLMAIQNDGDLWSKAYAKKILLISPTNLMAAVKMVSDLWKRDQQSKNALEIARQGERLYDKFINFLGSMDDIGKHINKTQDAFTQAVNQLKHGRGNLVRQAEKLKDLGVKSPKSLPATMMNYDIDPSEAEDTLAADLLIDEDSASLEN